VARGAGLAGLARAASLIEAVAQPIYTWLFGLATYGLYVALWGAVNLLSNIVDLSMTSALQRIVPAEDEETRIRSLVKSAFVVAVLPLLNSLIGVFIWVVLMMVLVPRYGGLGMALAVATATVATAYAAVIELRRSDNLWPFERRLFQGLGIALAGVLLMAGAEWLLNGPLRFGVVTLLWAATSWCALRFGLVRGDREALGSISRKLRLV
jgi:O-antigen/teichoic acid export membrane protein